MTRTRVKMKYKTRSNRIKWAPLLLGLPLLMASKTLPAKEPKKEYYRDITVEATFIREINPIQREYEYELKITNVGDEYAFNYVMQEYGKNGTLYCTTLSNDEQIFNSLMIKPGSYVLDRIKTYEIVNDFSFYTFVTEKLSIPDENIVFRDNYLEKVSDLCYELKGTIKNRTNHYYGYVLDITYLDQDYSVFINPENGLRTKVDLDLDKLTIKGIKAFKSYYERPIEDPDNPFYHINRYGVAYIIILFVALPIIIGPIIILVIINKRKKKKKIAK